MPKTVPKSSNDEHRNLASVPRGGVALSQQTNKRKLEPNDAAEDLSGSSRKRPNRAEIVDQRSRSAEVDQRRRPPPPPEVNATTQEQEEAEDRARSNYLLEALRRIQELQDEIEFLENDPYEEDEDSEDESGQFYGQDRAGAGVIVGRQAEALGFAVCARETMAFLEREGVPRDAPMMVNLRARLIGEGN